MNIQSKTYQPTFTARNAEVRYADKIMRNLMLEYPAFSSSRVKFYDCYQKQRPKVFEKVLPIYWKLHAERNDLSKYKGIDLINATLEMVKKNKNAYLIASVSKKMYRIFHTFSDYQNTHPNHILCLYQ